MLNRQATSLDAVKLGAPIASLKTNILLIINAEIAVFKSQSVILYMMNDCSIISNNFIDKRLKELFVHISRFFIHTSLPWRN